MRLLTALLAAAALTACALAPPVRADGDPASDTLLGDPVFYPYQPPVSAQLQQQLNATARAAAKAGLPLKVALIGSPIDLGTIPELFGKPQAYANFLDQEISFQGPQPLLVVMAAGYGVKGVKPAVVAAARTLTKPVSGSSDDLAKAALAAIPLLAKADGHPTATASASSSSGSSPVLLIVLIAAAIVAASAVLLLRGGIRRRR